MIREDRNRDKLDKYHHIYSVKGIIDPNVHPWIGEGWQKSPKKNLSGKKLLNQNRLSVFDLNALQQKHEVALNYLDTYMSNMGDFMHKYQGCLTLLDSNCRVIKRYTGGSSLPVFDKYEGADLSLEKVGTMACNMVKEHGTPFWIFGPEIWLSEFRDSNAGAVPIFIKGKLAYIIEFVAVDYNLIQQDLVLALLYNLQTALSIYLAQEEKISIQSAILDAAPFAVYHVAEEDSIVYANKLGMDRLAAIRALNKEQKVQHLRQVVLNYESTPIYRGFQGESCINKETTWITHPKTYEDITTVVPLTWDEDKEKVESIVTISMPIEDMRRLVAHASGYTAKYDLSAMVGESKAFKQMMERSYRVARNRNHVMLQGEAGVGKQRLAHGIHMASPRISGPLITLNCGDYTPDLLELDLFGGITKLDYSHPGKLELATKGTLFIDEIEKMPLHIAAQLAKALNTKQNVRVGEDLKRNIDVRIIVATDTNLRRLTEQGEFDEQLFHIISRSIIRVPSLRTRREDIPLIAANILEELAKQNQLPEKKCTPETMEVLKEYDWPGNTKQLQRVLECAFFNTENEVLLPSDINLMGNIKPDNTWKKDKDVFVKAWQAAGGNISRLSSLLGVSRVTLYRYLKKYDMEK